jgi:hypothetical protein
VQPQLTRQHDTGRPGADDDDVVDHVVHTDPPTTTRTLATLHFRR